MDIGRKNPYAASEGYKALPASPNQATLTVLALMLGPNVSMQISAIISVKVPPALS